jgi:hypothetical protein
MEPRWQNSSVFNDVYIRYLGGVGRFDLWLRTDGSTILVRWGPKTEHWVAYVIRGRRLPDKADVQEKNMPTLEELALIRHYLALFVPELGLKSRYMEHITDGT